MEGFLIRAKFWSRVLGVMLVIAPVAWAHAHDEKPQYGGIVQSVKDIAYEIAPHEKGLMLYVEDHGNPVSTAGIAGTLVLIKGVQRTETELKPAGENRMLAAGVRLDAGQKATALLKMPSGRSVVVHFSAK